jgi:hypothetical protein
MPDDLFSELKANGYNPYSMPDRDFVPLAVLWQNKQKKFERVGLLQKFVEFSKDTPRPSDPHPLDPENKAEFSSIFTKQMDASIGAGILKNIFSAAVKTDISTKINFTKVDKVEIAYNNVVSDAIDPVEIAAFLDAGQPVKPGHVADLLEPNRTFVAYDTLRSDSFTVKCHAEEKADAVTEVSVLKNVIKTDSTIKMSEETDTSLTFKDLGFQAFAIRVYPFWIMTKSGKRSFFFQPEPPSWFDSVVHSMGSTRGPGSGVKEHRPEGSMVNKSYVLPEGAFFRF